MPNATVRANARTLPQTTPTTENVHEPSRRGILGTLAAIAASSTAGLAVIPTLASASAPSPERSQEDPEFIALVDRFRKVYQEQNDAVDEEKSARVRFAAEAPLRPKKPESKYPEIYYDIVREQPTFEDSIDALKKGIERRKSDKNDTAGSTGNPLGVRLKKSVLNAYQALADNPSYTKEGDVHRRMMGASERWERALHASARDTGYQAARQRRRVADKDMREVVAEILKQKPKTIHGLQMQAGACLADPAAQWGQHPNALAFLMSAIHFGNSPTEEEVA